MINTTFPNQASGELKGESVSWRRISAFMPCALVHYFIWYRLWIRCIIDRHGQEETFAFGELVLWIKGLFIDIWKCGLLPAFRFSVSYPVHIEHPLNFTHQRMH